MGGDRRAGARYTRARRFRVVRRGDRRRRLYGLSTALAERGVNVRVIDGAQPGWGASGRNGGQVIPGLKYDPDELIRRFGDEAGSLPPWSAGRPTRYST